MSQHYLAINQGRRASRLSLVSCLASWLGISALLVSPALAQVNGPGPSPSELFDTVVNLPGDEAVITGEDSLRIGGVEGQTIQVNVDDNGILGRDFRAQSGAEVNISGGTVGSLDASNGSEANINGGVIVNVTTRSGSEVKISGGAVQRILAFEGSDVELIGGEFRLNGADFSDDTISSLVFGDVFTGTLADGSILLLEDFTFGSAVVNLTVVDLPAADLTPMVVNNLIASGPSGLRAGQTLTLQDGGSLGNRFTVVDATLNVTGGGVGDGAKAANSVVNITDGTVGSTFRAFSSSVNISGGTVGADSEAFSGSEVNISGGNVGSRFGAFSGSVVNISGGKVGNTLESRSGSVMNISGGTVGRSFGANGGEVNISGGTVGQGFRFNPGGDVELIGGEFRLNGVDFSGSTISLRNSPRLGDVLTGTLADGSTFIFSDFAHTGFFIPHSIPPDFVFPISVSPDFFGVNNSRGVEVTLTTVPLPAANLTPTVVSNPIVSGPSGLRAGQTLTLQDGGVLRDNFAVVGATLNVTGGFVGEGVEVFNSEVNISGGTVGPRFIAYSGSAVNVSGGTVGEGFFASSGSVVNISGGTMGDNLITNPGSVVNISGGTVSDGFNISAGSAVNIFGSEFFIDGEQLDTLVPGEAFTITDRNGTLSGVLVDGEPFSFDLGADFPSPFEDYFDPNATLTVTLGSPAILGDVNLDGDVNFLDISTFIGILTTGEFQTEGDCNQDGVVNFLDVQPFIEILTNT